MPPNQQWHCNISMTMLVICQYSSTLFILFMTFERFYSIIRPHKAASFNTVKRAKITISCIVCFSSFVCIPNLFLTLTIGRSCFIFGKGMTLEFMKIYQWVRVAFAFLLPFLLLLIMNSFIIHTLRNRSSLFKQEEDDSNNSSNHRNNRKTKHSENQVYITLLTVTFSFLTLLAPIYTYELVIEITGYSSKSPFSIAVTFLYLEIASQMANTNYGINFFLYALSGSKFRNDLRALFRVTKATTSENFRTKITTSGTRQIEQ